MGPPLIRRAFSAPFPLSGKAAPKGPASNKLARVAVTTTRVPRAPRKLKFDWDQNNRAKCEARLPIAEIEGLFKRPDTAFADDPKLTEKRYRAMGVSSKGEPIFVVFKNSPRIWSMVDPANQCAICSGRGSSKMAHAKKLKSVPKFKSDAEAEQFVETADLSEYDVFANASPRDEWFAKFEALHEDAAHAKRLAARRKAAKAKAAPVVSRKRA